MSIEFIESPHAPPAIGPYSHGAKVGNLIFLSGQLPLEASTGKIVEGTAADQLRVALKNADAILAAAGTSLASVVKTTVFVTDMGAFSAINAVYAEIFGAHAPARSVVEVRALPRDAQVEIELIAVAPEQSTS